MQTPCACGRFETMVFLWQGQRTCARKRTSFTSTMSRLTELSNRRSVRARAVGQTNGRSVGCKDLQPHTSGCRTIIVQIGNWTPDQASLFKLFQTYLTLQSCSCFQKRDTLFPAWLGSQPYWGMSLFALEGTEVQVLGNITF